MSEYKENTVGWQLSQLKEPLMSMCIGYFKHDAKDTINRVADTIHVAMEICYIHGSGSSRFILGAKDYLIAPDCFDYTANAKGREYKQGWDMAKECAPDNWLKPKDGGEDKAVVDSPKKTMELFFYADETLINPLRNPFKEPLVIYPRGEMNSVIVDEDKIKELMNANPGVTFWNGNVELSWGAREIDAPERAVVGYEEPKPIDTIEKKHELRIKNLELEIKRQADDIEFLKSSLDFVITRVGNLSKNG